jgi:hypothetical protein
MQPKTARFQKHEADGESAVVERWNDLVISGNATIEPVSAVPNNGTFVSNYIPLWAGLAQSGSSQASDAVTSLLQSGALPTLPTSPRPSIFFVPMPVTSVLKSGTPRKSPHFSPSLPLVLLVLVTSVLQSGMPQVSPLFPFPPFFSPCPSLPG